MASPGGGSQTLAMSQVGTRLREAPGVARGHPAAQWQGQGSTPELPVPTSLLPTEDAVEGLATAKSHQGQWLLRMEWACLALGSVRGAPSTEERRVRPQRGKGDGEFERQEQLRGAGGLGAVGGGWIRETQCPASGAGPPRAPGGLG